MEETKNIALVAHDNRKKNLIEWVEWNYQPLLKHRLICTGTTGKMVENALQKKIGDGGFLFKVLKTSRRGRRLAADAIIKKAGREYPFLPCKGFSPCRCPVRWSFWIVPGSKADEHLRSLTESMPVGLPIV